MFILGMISVFIGISLLAPDDLKGMMLGLIGALDYLPKLIVIRGNNSGIFRRGDQRYSSGLYNGKSSKRY